VEDPEDAVKAEAEDSLDLEQSNPDDLFSSLEGDSGLEHSSDEVDLPSLVATEPPTLLKDPHEEEEEEASHEIDLGDTRIPPMKSATTSEKIDFAALEEEVLGDEMVEPVTDPVVEDKDITEEKEFSKRPTTDLITDMLNQMVVDSSANEAQVAIR